MKNPRRRLSLAFGLLVIVFAASKPWRSETESLVSLASTPVEDTQSHYMRGAEPRGKLASLFRVVGGLRLLPCFGQF